MGPRRDPSTPSHAITAAARGASRSAPALAPFSLGSSALGYSVFAGAFFARLAAGFFAVRGAAVFVVFVLRAVPFLAVFFAAIADLRVLTANLRAHGVKASASRTR